MPTFKKTRWLAAALAFAAGCAPTVEKDPIPTESASTLALFSPDGCAKPSTMPFPTDLVRSPQTGRLELPFCPADTADETSMKTGLRTLDGFGVGTTISLRFSAPIDPASLPGAVVLMTAAGTPVTFSTQLGPDNTLYIVPGAPLEEKTQYVVVVTTGVKDADGEPVGADKVFTFVQSKSSLVDASGYSAYASLSDAEASQLEKVRAAYAPLLQKLEQGLHLPRAKFAAVWAFTTQTVHASLPQLAQLVSASPATVTQESVTPAAAHPLIQAAGIPTDNLCNVYSGRIALKNLLTATGTFGVDAQGNPAVSGETVKYLLATPKRAANGQTLDCNTPWAGDRVVVFAHGLGRCKNDALALADNFGAAGWAVLSIDGPRAGARTVTNSGDQDVDGCNDQPATPELIALPGQKPNPFAVRDHLREWALELVQVTLAAKNQPRAFVGTTSAGPATKVALLGHSWGGMAATLAGSVSGALDSLVVNGASAELGTVFAPAIRASVAADLETAGVRTSTAQGQLLLQTKTAESVAAFRWALEPADPLHAPVPAALPALVQVVSAGSTFPDAPLHETVTQSRLAEALNRQSLATVTHTLELTDGTDAASCEDASAVVGALLKPCVEAGTPAYSSARVKTALLRGQVVKFIASSGALVCDPALPPNAAGTCYPPAE